MNSNKKASKKKEATSPEALPQESRRDDTCHKEGLQPVYIYCGYALDKVSETQYESSPELGMQRKVDFLRRGRRL